MNKWVAMWPLGMNPRLKERGNILIRLKNSEHQLISNVYYVPNMKSNILSLGQLLEKGYDIQLKGNNLSIRDNANNLIAKVPMTKNRTFTLNIQNVVAKCQNVLQRYIYALASSIWASQFWGVRVTLQEEHYLPYAPRSSVWKMSTWKAVQEKLPTGVKLKSSKTLGTHTYGCVRTEQAKLTW